MYPHKMTEKNQEQRIQQCHRRLFLLKGVAYLSGALFGLNLFSNAKAGQSRIFPINTPPLQKLPLSAFAPRIAFIIDDIGSSISRAQAFLDLKMPMTFSIHPKLKYSDILAEKIYEHGQEIMLHQPMEPYGHEVDPGPGALYISYRDTEIEEIIEENLSQIPQATGVNNHMGSRFTSSSSKVVEALKIIKQKDLFFCGQFDEQSFTGLQNGQTVEHEDRTEERLFGHFSRYTGCPPTTQTFKAICLKTWGSHRHRTSSPFHPDSPL